MESLRTLEVSRPLSLSLAGVRFGGGSGSGRLPFWTYTLQVGSFTRRGLR